MFLWAQLPDKLDSSEIAKRALERGLVLAPGNVFSLSQTASQFLRFNVAQCADKRVFEVLAKTMRS
jgi:DNA-binding transcriptional MocR family regulator